MEINLSNASLPEKTGFIGFYLTKDEAAYLLKVFHTVGLKHLFGEGVEVFVNI